MASEVETQSTTCFIMQVQYGITPFPTCMCGTALAKSVVPEGLKTDKNK